MNFYLRFLLTGYLVVGFCGIILSQDIRFAEKVIEYCPAPGQFINNPLTGTPEAAKELAGKTGMPVSLGGYGGYIIFGFDKPVLNNPANPFGVDFIIIGNAMENNSEQGIVKVMKDENKNGLPDDTWYELKGSDHYLPGYRKNYSIQYDNPKENADVSWTDNFFNTGFIYKNSYHSQNLYPSAEHFPYLDQDSLVFKGSVINGRVKELNGVIISERSFFGYADNTPFTGFSGPLIPDNPYTQEIEGCGGDAMDISWAIDEDGKFVELDEIDFVKIYTGVNRSAGWLGEISTEVGGIAVVSPVDGISGHMEMIMPIAVPASVPSGSEITPEVMVFNSGRPVNNERIVWESSNNEIAIFQDNKLHSLKPGLTLIKASLESSPSVYFYKEIRVYEPSGIILGQKKIAIHEGESRKLDFKVIDNNNIPVDNSHVQYSISNPEVADVLYPGTGNELIIKGLLEGETYINISLAGSDDISEKLMVHVYKPLDEVMCYFAVRQNGRILIPRNITLSGNFDYTPWIDRKPDTSSFNSGFVSMASLISQAMIKHGYNSQGNTFLFRMDEKSGGELYLWQVTEDWDFTYGWGGSGYGGAFNSCWALTVNGDVYMNGLDKIPVRNGDIISLNYVKDITEVFKEFIIREENPGGRNDNSRNFRALSYTYMPDNRGGFTNSIEYLSNERIIVISPYGTDDIEKITGNEGEFVIDFVIPGQYTISAEGHPDEALIVNAGPTGISSFTATSETRIYPNPAGDILNIETGISGDFEYTISGITGNLVKKGKFKNQGKESLSVCDLISGVYLISLTSGEVKIHLRFIKK